MKHDNWYIFIISLIWLNGHFAYAQQKPYSTQFSLGVSAPMLDSGWGVHIGVNPTYRLISWCSAEAQFSYLYTRTTSTFISGRMAHVHSINLLGGARIYFNGENKKHRFFLNFLFGLNRVRELSEDLIILPEINAGLSSGFFYTNQKLVVGFCLEAPQNLMLKAGYRF